MTIRKTESGNIFFALFGAVALIGVVGAATSTLMRGPLSTVVSVNQRAKADTQMQIASKLAMVRATQEVANGGDCDMDGTIEPIPPDAMTGATLVGGGALPASIGSSQIDPWNTRYGYCVWDLGAKVDDPGCGSGSRLNGGLNESYPVMVIISAGPDKQFQTECNPWVGGNAPPYIPDNADVLVDQKKNTPNDDIILGYTYSEAVQAAGGLWSLMSGDPGTITTDKNVAFSSGNVDFSSGTTANFQGTAQFAANSRLDLGLGGMFLLPDETKLPTCNVANDAALRINKSSSLNVIEMCDPGATALYPNGWVPLGGAGATVAKIDDLTDAISYPGKGILFMGDGSGISYSSSTGGMNNIGIGIGAASSLVTGAGNIVLGDHPLTAGTSNSIVLGNGVNGVVGNNSLRLGNLLYGANIYSSSGSLGIGGVPSATLDVNGPAEANRFQMDNNTYMGSVSSDMVWVTGGATRMMLNTTGNLGVGATPTGSRLTVGGDTYVDGDTSSNYVIVRNNGSAGTPSLRFGSGSGTGFYTNGGDLGFATNGNNRAWLNNNGFGIGTTPNVALDVVGQGNFTDRVTATGFQFSSGQGLFPSGSGLSLNAGGTPQFYLSALGNVGIGVASPNAALDVDGAIRVGHVADSECDTARAGSIRYTSGDRLQICSDSTGDWETIGTSGGGGGGSGSYWSRVSTIDPRLFYTLGDVGVGVSDPLADFHVNGNLLATGTFGSGDTTPVSGSGTRMMFIPNKAAFRAGGVTGAAWDNASIGNYSTAFGRDVTASGSYTFVTGVSSAATQDYAFAAGRYARAQGGHSVALGHEITAGGVNSFAFGLGDASAPVPVVSGQRSFGIFMGDQAGVNITTNNLMALLGGRMIIDPNPVSATNIVPSGLLTVDVQGDIGAVQYCDENGANCFTASDIAGGGVGVWEDASNVIRLTSGTVNYSSASFVFGSPQLNHDGDDAHYNRFFYDKTKAAFRAGRADGIYWDAAEMGYASIGLGYNTWAKGDNSIAIGHNMGVTGKSAIALGHGVDVDGENSMALGLGDAAGPDPRISAPGALGIFMGDQSGIVLSSANTMGLFGGRLVVDPGKPATRLSAAGSLALNVEGQVGATEYCDQDGLNCFTASGIGSAYGADGTIQYASAGKFHSNPDFVYDLTTNNVGIGNAAPSQKLHVTGKIRATQSLMLDPVAGAAPFFMNLSDLGDTTIGTATGGDLLTYNGTTGRWENKPSSSLSVNAAGADRQLQFNNNGAFGADGNFVYSAAGYLGVGVATPQAQLDVGGTGSILIPRGTQAQRPAGINGMIRYNNTSNRFEVYQGGAWQDMLTGAATGSFLTLTDTPSSYAGSANQYVRVNTATNALEFTDQLVGTFTGQPAPDFMGLGDLSDVNLSVAPTNGQTLVYDNATSRWIAGAPAAAAAGVAGDIQFNNAGVLGADSTLSFGAGNLYLGLPNTDHTVVNHSPGSTYSGKLNVVKYGGGTDGGIHVGIHGASLGTSKDVYALITQRRNGSTWIGGTAVGMGQYLPGIAFAGNTSGTHGSDAGMQIGASIQGLVDGTVTAGVIPTSIVMHTTQTNSTGLTEQLRITSVGDIIMSGTGALTVLRGTDAQRPTAPVNGMFRYNNTSNKFEGYQNGAWQDLLTNAAIASAAGADGQVQFNNSGNLGASAGLSFSSSTGALSVGNANTVLLQGAAIGESPVITSAGAGTNVGLTFDTKGSGAFRFIGGNYNPVTFEAINDAFVVVKGNSAASRAGISLRNDGSNQWNIISNPGSSQLEFIFSNNVNAAPNYIFRGSGDLYMYGTGALALNAGTSAQRPGTPRNGMLRYNNENNKFEGYQGGAWQDILTGAASGGTFLALTDTPSTFASAANQFVRVNAGTSALEFTDQVIGSVTGQPLPSFIDLNDLGDVDLTVAPTNGQVLKFDNTSGTWKAGAAGSLAAGANTQIQYNNGGNIAASPVFSLVSDEIIINASSINKPGVLRIKGSESPAANYLDAMVALESTASGDIWTQAIMSGQPGRVGDYVFAHYNGSTWAEPLTFAKNNRIGIFAVTPQASFDINTTDAMIVPRGTTAQQPASPVNGMVRYNTTTEKFEGYQNGAWIDVVGGVAGATSQIQYNNNGVFGASTNFVLDASGKVGIGTDAPRSRLDLREATGVSSYFRLRSGSVTLPSYSGSATLNELSGGNTILNMGMSTGPQNNIFNMGGAIVHGLTASGANAWSPLYLLGTHGGSAPTLAAVTIAGQRHNGSTNRAALTGTMPILDVMSFYDNSSTYLAMRVQANGDLTVANNISYSGTLTDTSDMRLKTDIHPLRNRGSMLDKIGQIDTYSFRMKANKDGQVEFGVMAQELVNIFPELVETDTSTPENYLSVNYIGLIAPLVQATQELKAENDNLKSQLSSLESKMASIEADMKGMKAYTGYGIGKAGFGLGMAGGMALIGGLGGALLLNRRRKAA